MNTIFKDFVVSFVYAPAIIFQNIIVCGQAFELNCISDLSINLTVNDIALLNHLRLSYADVFTQNNTDESKTRRKISHTKSINSANVRVFTDQFDNNYLSDSGFKSNCYQEKIKMSEKPNDQKKEVPYIYSFIGGHFSMRLYKNSVKLFIHKYFMQIKRNINFIFLVF